MRIKHIDHINFTVKNLAESVEWYSRIFGFESQEAGIYQDKYPWQILRAGEALLCMYEYPERSHPLPTGPEAERFHSLGHYAFRITDREAWEAMIAREAIPLREGDPIDYPHSTAWYVYDPTGYEIEVSLWHGDAVQFSHAEAMG
ncbi:MAG: catechol 2,3-dioxygenase-like lactoylglutathione lyase family enzyme [Planctomycetota bacterium]|jgi:catechol 2,3-dioxygenase-like lactoylglutathione lyase family enzyme